MAKQNDLQHCAACKADGPMYMHGRCHPFSPTWAVLLNDVLTIECAECKKPIVRFKVSELIRTSGAKELINAGSTLQN